MHVSCQPDEFTGDFSEDRGNSPQEKGYQAASDLPSPKLHCLQCKPLLSLVQVPLSHRRSSLVHIRYLYQFHNTIHARKH
jgi:hypothetical protein